MSRDFIAGCFLLIFAVVYYLAAAAIPASQLSDTVGPGGLPKAYGMALGLLSVLLIAQSLLAQRRAAAMGDAAKRETARLETTLAERHAAWRALGMLAIGIAYLILLPIIGYAVALALLIFAAAWYQEGKRRTWLIPIAIVGAGCFWVVFVEVLKIAQPAGFWPSLF